MRPVGIDIRTLSQMEANCEKKENILKEALLKQRIDSLTEQFTQLISDHIKGPLNCCSVYTTPDEGTRQECRNVGSMYCDFFGYIH